MILYGLAVVVSGVVAVPMERILLGGGVGEVVIFLAYGMTFPQHRVVLMFMFPVPAGVLALMVAGGYGLYLLSLGAGGAPCGVGLLCGAGYVFYVNRSRRGVKRRVGSAVQAVSWWARRKGVEAEMREDAVDETMAAVPTEHLERQVRGIVAAKRDDGSIREGERLLVEALIQRMDPGKELCAPQRAGEERQMCPLCEELGVCLRQFLEKRRTIVSEESR